ncbi:MAG: hypothetical protein SVP52_05910 [Chloroflexota bacterium]|nr:hypothetical protein [Chloroflexota bacterium]
MSATSSEEKRPFMEPLIKENDALRARLEEQETTQKFFWDLLVEIARRMQLSSTSIKVAVSSLLSNEIFWDPVNQHEFFETINNSANVISDSVVLLSLAFRAKANKLVLKMDPQILQEILATIQRNAQARLKNVKIALELSSSNQTVKVDYEYTSIALVYLLDIISEYCEDHVIRIVANEKEGNWYLDFKGAKREILMLIYGMQHYQINQISENGLNIPPEKILGLHIACEICRLQQLSTTIIEDNDRFILRLIIPGSPGESNL